MFFEDNKLNGCVKHNNFGDISVTLLGNKLVNIENYKKLLKCSKQEISIKTSKYIVNIKGENLEIISYNKEELSMRGTINEVSFV